MNLVVIAATGMKAELAGLPAGTSTEEKVARVFAASFEHNGPCWCVRNDDERFQACAAGLLLHFGLESEEGLAIQAECKVLSALSTAASGVPIDFRVAFEGLGERKSLGLASAFRVAKEADEARFKGARRG